MKPSKLPNYRQIHLNNVSNITTGLYLCQSTLRLCIMLTDEKNQKPKSSMVYRWSYRNGYSRAQCHDYQTYF